MNGIRISSNSRARNECSSICAVTFHNVSDRMKARKNEEVLRCDWFNTHEMALFMPRV